MKKYRIGNYAKYLGVTPDLLKHYEDMGIIHSDRSESGYRYYSFLTTVELIESIRLRNFGLTLREIRDILSEHSLDNEGMEEIFEERMKRLRQEIQLDEALEEDYAAFCRWKAPLADRDWDWEIRWSRPMLFLPHTDRYDFLPDPRIYELLNTWMSFIPIVRSTMRTDLDGGNTWGFIVEEEMARRLELPVNEIVERILPCRILYYKFRGSVLRLEEENAGNPAHPAFRLLRSLGMESKGPYFRTTLMPADWKGSLGYQYGYYSIPLKELCEGE